MRTLFKTLAFSLLLGTAGLALAQDAVSVNVNTAGVEALTQLPGIGSTKAQAIVADRDANGPFDSADDLDRVDGIGAATVEGLRDRVEF